MDAAEIKADVQRAVTWLGLAEKLVVASISGLTWLLPILVLISVLAGGYFMLKDLYDIGSAPMVSIPINRPAPAVAAQPTAKVTIAAPVTVYQGDSKQALALPPDVQRDDHQQVLAANQVQSDLRPQTITTVVNTETGATQTFVKDDPYPWLAVERHGEVRMGYGYKYSAASGHTETVGRLAINYDLVRIKALTFGVTGTVDTDRETFVGVGIIYKF